MASTLAFRINVHTYVHNGYHFKHFLFVDSAKPLRRVLR